MLKQKLLEMMVLHNLAQMKVSEEMIKILEMQLKLIKNYNNNICSLILLIQNNSIPPTLAHSLLANFANLKDNYHFFFTQCAENLMKQLKSIKESTIVISNEYSKTQ